MGRLLEWTKKVYPSLVGIFGGFLLLIFFGKILEITAAIIIGGGVAGLILSWPTRKITKDPHVVTKSLEETSTKIKEMRGGNVLEAKEVLDKVSQLISAGNYREAKTLLETLDTDAQSPDIQSRIYESKQKIKSILAGLNYFNNFFGQPTI